MVSYLKDVFKGYSGKLNKNKRLLQERSHLAIEFPQSDNRIYRTFIPMLENPTISEKGKANLNEYSLLGRAGQLFSYAGADARNINLTFNISLLHIIEVDSEEGISDKFKRQFNLFFNDKERAIELFDLREEINLEEFAQEAGFQSEEFTQQNISEIQSKIDSLTNGGRGDFNIKDPEGLGRPHAAINRNYYRKLIGRLTGSDIAFEDELNADTFVGNAFLEAGIPTQSDSLRQLNSLIDLVYVWINLIRASILNRSNNTVFGPPIVRLTHGPMYSNVPCLVEGYDIKIVDEAGYEAETLTPKKIEVSLSLVESRTGNFGSYQAGQIENGDNLTGWESIITNNEIDPYNGLITGDDWAK
jgi:hypothetical protein